MMRRIFHAPVSIVRELLKTLRSATQTIVPYACTRCGHLWEARPDSDPYVCPDCIRIEEEKKHEDTL